MNSKFIIALGSNFEPESNIKAAAERLRFLFPDIVFSRSLRTKPIGIVSADFVNALSLAHTSLPIEDVERQLKQVERMCGRCAEEKERGIIRMDIDLLLYGEEKLHLKDWNRDYILTLLGDLEEESH